MVTKDLTDVAKKHPFSKQDFGLSDRDASEVEVVITRPEKPGRIKITSFKTSKGLLKRIKIASTAEEAHSSLISSKKITSLVVKIGENIQTLDNSSLSGERLSFTILEIGKDNDVFDRGTIRAHIPPRRLPPVEEDEEKENKEDKNQRIDEPLAAMIARTDAPTLYVSGKKGVWVKVRTFKDK